MVGQTDDSLSPDHRPGVEAFAGCRAEVKIRAGRVVCPLEVQRGSSSP